MIRLSRSTAVLPLAVFLLPAWLPGQESTLPKGYVGSETCAGCHDEVSTAFAKNPHHALSATKWRGLQERACEACHGPGAKHAETNAVDDILNPAKMAPAAVDKMCLSCHRNSKTQVGAIQNGHARSAVACTSCHTVHKTGEQSSGWQFRTAMGVNKKCASCHTNVWASFQKPHHHKVPEGAMSCTSCHNPHGSVLARNIRTANSAEPGCNACHADKRGPFVFEHAPVRTEPCSTCHEPHGSANPRMLTRHVVANQCLECHSNIVAPANGIAGGVPPALHDMRQAKYRNCTMCHQKIHGSNVNRGLLR
ncbi:MAG TPA: DmsE family decaheme c-type cytochrome [Bryobacteraceae bacterium]|nr:DmsE family decaheme c-type cytochrome [Bryobacteraceae bacterium]HPT27674.1 DmsE family decaheme c-type cytochrome [Bryobacteraceae bacterium]